MIAQHRATKRPHEAFPERLRALQKERGCSQGQLARIIYTSQTTVSFWSHGRRYPGIGHLVSLADYFDTTVDYLLGRTDER